MIGNREDVRESLLLSHKDGFWLGGACTQINLREIWGESVEGTATMPRKDIRWVIFTENCLKLAWCTCLGRQRKETSSALRSRTVIGSIMSCLLARKEEVVSHTERYKETRTDGGWFMVKRISVGALNAKGKCVGESHWSLFNSQHIFILPAPNGFQRSPLSALKMLMQWLQCKVVGTLAEG